MTELLLVLAGAVGTIIVEMIVIVGIAVRRVIKGDVLVPSGQNSRVRQKETVIPVLGKE